MSSANTVLLLTFQEDASFFSCLITPAVQCVMLNRSGERGHPGLISDLRGRHPVFH